MQRGGGSKDTWVLADGPTPQFSLLRPGLGAAGGKPGHLRPAQPGGRQPVLAGPLRGTGRAGGAHRARDPAAHLPGSGPRQGRGGQRRPAGALAAWVTSAPSYAAGEQSPGAAGARSARHDLRFWPGAAACPGICIRCAALAWLLRDRISADAWRILNHFARAILGLAAARAAAHESARLTCSTTRS